MSNIMSYEEEYSAKNEKRVTNKKKKNKYKPEGSYSRHVKWLEQNEKHRRLSQRNYERIFKHKHLESDEE